jgi:hypothetical protein
VRLHGKKLQNATKNLNSHRFFHSGVRIKPNTSFQTLPLANAQTCIGEEGSAPDYRQTGVATSGFTTYIEVWEEEIGGRWANERGEDGQGGGRLTFLSYKSFG